jgi:hypothetical protein
LQNRLPLHELRNFGRTLETWLAKGG